MSENIKALHEKAEALADELATELATHDDNDPVAPLLSAAIDHVTEAAMELEEAVKAS